MRRLRSVFLLSSSWLSVAVCAGPSLAADPAEDERIVVTAARLEDRDVPTSEVPAHVTVLDRERIAASSARNLQDLLAVETGIVLFDQVGNDVQKTLDLRGFGSGKGVAVFVDGARVNDPRNNVVALEQVPLDAVERVEITRGPGAALAGGGAEAGVIRVITRRGTDGGASLAVAAGSWNTQRYDGTYGGDYGRVDLFLSGSYDTTDGFRPNAGGDQLRWSATAGIDLGAERRLSLALLSSDLDMGNPGALTLAEFEADPGQNTYNLLDSSDTRMRQAALSFQGGVGAGFSLAANLAYRDDRAKTLSTGRAAASFGGFYLDADGGTWTGAVQATHDARLARGTNRIAFGVELLDGETRSAGYFTPPSDPGSYEPASPDSLNTAGARNAAVFLQDTWTVSPRWTIAGGVRGDTSRVHYAESVPGTTPSDDKSFSEVSLRAAATFHPAERVDLYVSVADAFLPPTPEQLFAFPFFGSNPDLEPEDARAYELGARLHGETGTIEAALFWTDTRDEIVFDPTPTLTDPFGRNVNAGAARRLGVEASVRGRIARSLAAFANATYTAAAFTDGVNDGNDVPLVPRFRAAAGIDATLPRGFALRADVLYVGSQVLDNDPANARTRLAAYTVVNARAAWERALERSSGSRAGRIGLFVEARNLLDETYATRGIFALDLSTFTPTDFVTPAPGRRYLAGVTWRM